MIKGYETMAIENQPTVKNFNLNLYILTCNIIQSKASVWYCKWQIYIFMVDNFYFGWVKGFRKIERTTVNTVHVNDGNSDHIELFNKTVTAIA